jgi:hypothetical protein
MAASVASPPDVVRRLAELDRTAAVHKKELAELKALLNSVKDVSNAASEQVGEARIKASDAMAMAFEAKTTANEASAAIAAAPILTPDALIVVLQTVR